MSKSQAQEFFKKKKDEIKGKIGKKDKDKEADEKGGSNSKMPEGLRKHFEKKGK